MRNTLRPLFSVQTLLWLALLLALAGSLRHLAAMFASIDGNWLYGYLSAIAVDAGLFALSYSVRQRKAQGRNRAVLWLGIVLFTTISIYGNYTYGLLATGSQLTPWLDTIRPIILAASLPVLVLYLAELVSDNAHFTPAPTPDTALPDEANTPLNLPKFTSATPLLASANSAKQEAKEQRLDTLLAYLADNPQATLTAAATEIGVSRQTVRTYVDELTGCGRLQRNGHGWEVPQ
ncbi:MAG: hypothetical protein Kow0031_28930 [Anaerolineae bacterium]